MRAHLVLLTCLAVPVLAAGPALAGVSGSTSLTYEVYLGGLEMVRADFNLGLKPGRYDLRLNFKPSSWLGHLLPWTMEAHSAGRIGPGALVPERAGEANTWRGRRRFVSLGRRGVETVVMRADPMPAASGRLKVPEPFRRGTVDLAAAVLQVALTIRGGACHGSVPVYDGRRRYNLHLSHAGTARLARSRYSAYEGEAVRCRVVMERLYGFKKPKSFPRLSSDQPLEVWFARPLPDVPPLPVRFELVSRWGDLRAHLALAQLEAGGRRHSLAVNR